MWEINTEVLEESVASKFKVDDWAMWQKTVSDTGKTGQGIELRAM
jgi:hypothetical protein